MRVDECVHENWRNGASSGASNEFFKEIMAHKSRWYDRKRRLLGLETTDSKRNCQNCLSDAHFTHECKEKMKYRKKESATQKLKRLRYCVCVPLTVNSARILF